MGSILFEHNRKAYEAAVCLMNETGRAAVVHPTGTGKSFLAFQLCADNINQKVCWLSPSEYIFRTQQEKWLLAGGRKPENLQFITYARLMRMKEDEIAEIQPDYIVLDEFHRCGAAQWGGGVERLRERYPDAKMLGLSATNIRYLDNQRDMAWELFGGNLASELTLGAAVVQGILPAPKYVLSVYSYQKELKRYEMRVRQTRNKAVRDAAERELEALRRALDKADGLEEIFAKHMQLKGGSGVKEAALNDLPRSYCYPESSEEFDCNLIKEGIEREWSDSGKYIVFCANYRHLIKMRELAPEWFAKVDARPHIYTAYSDDPAVSQEFEAFKADSSPHLKLLYCIDMLNEGIHVDGLDGVILLRPTVSPTLYKQQIGRALAAGGKKTPVIFDIVMNIENLCSIGAIEEELREAVFACHANGRADEIVREHFCIIDEAADCRKLFMQLNETLGASWEAMYAMAREYYKAHGNLEIPVHYATPDGYALGAWITTQRKVYSGRTLGNLSEAQIGKLNAIGMRWQGAQEASWEKCFEEAKKYYQENQNLEVPAGYVAESGCRLGRWVRRQRERYREAALWRREEEQMKPAALGNGPKEGSGIEMEKSGRKCKETSCKDNFKGTGKSGLETIRRIAALERIGMVWENSDSWEERFELARQYYDRHGNLNMPADYVVNGIWLDRWLREQKARLREETERTEEKRKSRTEGKMEGGTERKKDSKTAEKQNDRIKEKTEGESGKKRKFLSEEQKEKLSSIGLATGLSRTELSWRQQYGEAKEFFREHGNLSIPKRYVGKSGRNLGVWLQRQRTGRRSGQLSGEQVALLDGIGMVWNLGAPWETGFSHAREYYEQYGHLDVTNNYICADGYRLGKWISNQRSAGKGSGRGKGLKEEQVRRLEEIGMVWSAKTGRKEKSKRGEE